MASVDAEAWLAGLGTTLIVAPHPDDESIGCGGLIARLRQAGADVWVALVSDGTMSHPHSLSYPPAERRRLRHAEMLDALAVLGVGRDRLRTLGLVDGQVPAPRDDGFEPAVARLGEVLDECAAATVVVPWRRDPHPDHRASRAIAAQASARREPAPRMLEYFVWTDERGSDEDLPRPGEGIERRLELGTARGLKAQAIAAHRSQLGAVIVDDPHGFVLAPEMIERCLAQPERFVESMHAPAALALALP